MLLSNVCRHSAPVTGRNAPVTRPTQHTNIFDVIEYFVAPRNCPSAVSTNIHPNAQVSFGQLAILVLATGL